MHANFIKTTDKKKYNFKNKQHLARRKLQLEIKSLMIIGMSLLVDPPTGKAVQNSLIYGIPTLLVGPLRLLKMLLLMWGNHP
jgi:hypothetical protein